ncbi:MAG: MarR family transcriptional regulator [Thermoplasmatota archaeon]
MSAGARIAVNRILTLLGETFDLAPTARRLLAALEKSPDLTVRDLERQLRVSERAVRDAISALQRWGLVAREVRRTTAQRAAYVYRLPKVEALGNILATELESRLQTIERLVPVAAAAHGATLRARRVRIGRTKSSGVA